MPLILGAQSALAATGIVTNSCRFEAGDNTYMHRTQTAGDQKTWTLSYWVKRSDITAQQCCVSIEDGAAYVLWKFNTSEFFEWRGETGAARFITDAKYQDPTAWFHVVTKCDTTESVEANRFKIWINGTQITSFGTETYPSLNSDTYVNKSGGVLRIGTDEVLTSDYSGYLAEVVLTDGTAYDASSFGEFDSDSPTIWKPIDVSGLSFGTNGFYLDFEDSSDFGSDVSGQGNDLTDVNLAVTNQGTDNPINNFSTWNPLVPNYTPANNATYTDGNLSSTTTTTGGLGGLTSLGSDVSKWYAEIKLIAESSSDASMVGAYKNPNTGLGNNSPHDSIKFYGVRSNGTKYTATVASGSWGASYAAGDVMSLALDIDNERLYIAKNGLWCDGAGAYDQSSPTAYVTLSSGDEWFFGCGDTQGGGTAEHSANFGNPPYALTSAEADENGYGAFEYAPPTGYLALCTKNLATDGG